MEAQIISRKEAQTTLSVTEHLPCADYCYDNNIVGIT